MIMAMAVVGLSALADPAPDVKIALELKSGCFNFHKNNL